VTRIASSCHRRQGAKVKNGFKKERGDMDISISDDARVLRFGRGRGGIVEGEITELTNARAIKMGREKGGQSRIPVLEKGSVA